MAEKIVCGIYEIVNVVNNKRYIGLSANIYRRWREHINALMSNTHHNAHLQSAWNKYKQYNFKFNIIEQCKKECLSDREIYWIAYYDSFNNGYNNTVGGDGSNGRIMSDEQKQQISKNNIERFTLEENRLKQSIASDHRCTPIYQIDLDGNIVNEWRSIRWAANKLGISQQGISHAIHHRDHAKTYHGYIWIPKNAYNPKTFNVKEYLSSDRVCNTIYQYTKSGELCCEYNMVSYVREKGFNPDCVGRSCRNKTLYKNYYWSYFKYNTSEELFANEYGKSKRKYKEIYQYTLNGELIKKWNNINEVVNIGGFKKDGIRDCCTHRTNYSQGYYWSYKVVSDYSIFPIQTGISSQKLSKKVYQYTLDYQLIQEWPSLSYIHKHSEFTKANLEKCVKGIISDYNGFIFSYKEPSEIEVMDYAC